MTNQVASHAWTYHPDNDRAQLNALLESTLPTEQLREEINKAARTISHRTSGHECQHEEDGACIPCATFGVVPHVRECKVVGPDRGPGHPAPKHLHFGNFWANVSMLDIKGSVSNETNTAIAEGLRHA